MLDDEGKIWRNTVRSLGLDKHILIHQMLHDARFEKIHVELGMRRCDAAIESTLPPEDSSTAIAIRGRVIVHFCGRDLLNVRRNAHVYSRASTIGVRCPISIGARNIIMRVGSVAPGVASGRHSRWLIGSRRITEMTGYRA